MIFIEAWKDIGFGKVSPHYKLPNLESRDRPNAINRPLLTWLCMFTTRTIATKTHTYLGRETESTTPTYVQGYLPRYLYKYKLVHFEMQLQ